MSKGIAMIGGYNLSFTENKKDNVCACTLCSLYGVDSGYNIMDGLYGLLMQSAEKYVKKHRPGYAFKALPYKKLHVSLFPTPKEEKKDVEGQFNSFGFSEACKKVAKDQDKVEELLDSLFFRIKAIQIRSGTVVLVVDPVKVPKDYWETIKNRDVKGYIAKIQNQRCFASRAEDSCHVTLGHIEKKK